MIITIIGIPLAWILIALLGLWVRVSRDTRLAGAVRLWRQPA
jgi:hypothetical protein